MKKHLVLLLTLAATLMMASCTKEKNYYVKYEVKAYGTNHTGPMTLNVNTENGNQKFTVSSKVFSETFGPVAKGFEAKISASVNYPTCWTTNIYVSKGEDPFVLKATTSTSGAKYVIDF